MKTTEQQFGVRVQTLVALHAEVAPASLQRCGLASSTPAALMTAWRQGSPRARGRLLFAVCHAVGQARRPQLSSANGASHRMLTESRGAHRYAIV